MASPKKIIVVVGATGNQGSSVAHTFLKLPEWHVRAVTRDPSSSASQALSSLGAEVVKADLSDHAALSQAFSNANAIFVNTDFWGAYVGTKKALAGQEDFEAKASQIAFDKEVSWGKNAAHAAAAVPSLERYVYSTLPNIKTGSKGKYSSHHNETKGTVVDNLLKEQPELAKKASFIYLGAYTTNPFFAAPQFDPTTETFKFVLPLKKETKMPVIDPTKSTGPLVRALIEDEEPGTHLLAYDSYPTMAEIVKLWSKASGEEAEYVEVTTKICEKYRASKSCDDDHVIKLYLRNLRNALRAF
jgi:NmrA-like family